MGNFYNTYDNLYNVLVRWLDSVDSVTDRKLLILHSCGLSMNKIGKTVGLLRQTASRRYTNAIDALVWNLNHSKNYPVHLYRNLSQNRALCTVIFFVHISLYKPIRTRI